MRDCLWVLNDFRNARLEGFDYVNDCKSDRDSRYNCIAWAVGKTHQFWWPKDTRGYYWPPALPKEPIDEETVDNFSAAFHIEGYRRCWSRRFNKNYEKIALYVNSQGRPTHAARLLSNGVWTSKLGNWEDIEHKNLRCLEGDLGYGRAKFFFKRRLRRERKSLPIKFRSLLSTIFRKRWGKFSPIPKENPTAR